MIRIKRHLVTLLTALCLDVGNYIAETTSHHNYHDLMMASACCHCKIIGQRNKHKVSARIILLFSIVLLMFDVYSDWILVLTYILDGDLGWAGLTTMFITVPTLMYMLDGFLIASEVKDMAMKCWIIFMTIFQMAPFIRYIYHLGNSQVSEPKKRLEEKESKQKIDNLSNKIWSNIYGFTDEMDEIAKATRMRVAEALTEAAPQCCLQLYIMALQGTDASLSTVIIQVVSIVLSLMSISWTICAWDREKDSITLKKKDNDKNSQEGGRIVRHEEGRKHHQGDDHFNHPDEGSDIGQVTFVALIPILLSNILLISSRVLCISMFASHFREWIFLLLGLHVLVMFLFNFMIYKNHGENVNLKSIHPFFGLVTYTIRILGISLFQMFAELKYNFESGKYSYSYLHMTLYGILIFGENLGMIFSWYGYVEIFDHSTKLTILLCTLIPMVIGEVLAELYYICIYPHDEDEKTCFPAGVCCFGFVFILGLFITKVLFRWNENCKTYCDDEDDDND